MRCSSAGDFSQNRRQYPAKAQHRLGIDLGCAVSPSFANSTRSFAALTGILIHLMGIFRKSGNEAEGSTDLLSRPVLEEDDGGHDRFAHYVKKEKIVESAVTGKSVRALCGKKWTPSRDPEKYPICPTCKEIYAGLKPAPEDS